jgi:hypothetical protein
MLPAMGAICCCINLLLEGTALNATTTVARGQGNLSTTANAAVVLEEGTISAHAGLTAVKDGRVGEVIGMGEPVPVLTLLLVHTFVV